MFDCAEARNLVSRSDEVSLARPFKAGIICEIQDNVASATTESFVNGVQDGQHLHIAALSHYLLN